MAPVGTAPLFSLSHAPSHAWWGGQDRNTPKQIELPNPTSEVADAPMGALKLLGLDITRLGPATQKRVK